MKEKRPTIPGPNTKMVLLAQALARSLPQGTPPQHKSITRKALASATGSPAVQVLPWSKPISGGMPVSTTRANTRVNPPPASLVLLPLVLRQCHSQTTKDMSTPLHNPILENKETTEDNMYLLNVPEIKRGFSRPYMFPGPRNQDIKGTTGNMVLLSRFSSLLYMQLAGITGFKLQPVCEENKNMVPLGLHLVNDGVSSNIVYCWRKNSRPGTREWTSVQSKHMVAASKPSTRSKRQFRHNNNTRYSVSNMFWNRVCASANTNLKTVVDTFYMDLWGNMTVSKVEEAPAVTIIEVDIELILILWGIYFRSEVSNSRYSGFLIENTMKREFSHVPWNCSCIK